MELANSWSQARQLADSLCARLCHEFAGPLGTLMGALELAAEDAVVAPEALPLASEAANQMAFRLRLLRAAWAGDCGVLGGAALAELAAGLPPRIRAELDGLAGEFTAPVARVLVNMLLLGVEALPRGGSISLSGAPGDDVVLIVAGNQAAWPSGLPQVLADPAAAMLDPQSVQAPLVAQLAREAGLRLSLLLPAGGGGQEGAAPLLLSAA